jgi:hypothetical protein
MLARRQLGHAGEIEVWQNLGIHQRQYLLLISGLNILILLHNRQDILHGDRDERIRCNHLRPRHAHRTQQANHCCKQTLHIKHSYLAGSSALLYKNLLIKSSSTTADCVIFT